MKKLVFAALIAACTAAVQAASFNWTTSDKVYIIPTATIAGGLKDGQTYTAATLQAIATDFTDTYKGSLSYSLTLNDGTSTKTFTGNLAKSAGLSTMDKVSVSGLTDDIIVAGTDYTYDLVFTATLKDGKNQDVVLTSDKISSTWHSNDTGTMKLGTAVPGSWTASVAPEPTSGLLLLIGMAGLALRRRRA